MVRSALRHFTDGLATADLRWIPEAGFTPARLRIEQPITRCNATKVDPTTGIADADTLGALQSAFGNKQFGVYATVIEGGDVRLNDKVSAA